MKKKRKGLWLSLLIAAAFVFIMLYSNLAITYSRYEKRSGKLPEAFDGFKIMLLADLHCRSFGKDNARLIGMIDAENPDIILIAGDMVNSKKNDFSVFYAFAEQIGQKYETYFVYGNHEERFDSEVLAAFDDRLEGYGINIVNNTNVKIERDGAAINLYGLRLPLYFYSAVDAEGKVVYDLTTDKIKEMLGEVNDDEFNMLLSHNPVFFESYAKWGADMVFSGHIHGGVARLPFIGGVFSPSERFFPKYDAGEFNEGDSTLILSRGMGEHVAPLRFLNPADICVIELKSVTGD